MNKQTMIRSWTDTIAKLRKLQRKNRDYKGLSLNQMIERMVDEKLGN